MNSLFNLHKIIVACRISSGRTISQFPALFSGDELGRGSGKGGGAGGAIRSAGGSFGIMEATREEEYFRKLSQKQIHALKDHLEDEVEHHEHEIKKHEEAIKRHFKRVEEIKILVHDKPES